MQVKEAGTICAGSCRVLPFSDNRKRTFTIPVIPNTKPEQIKAFSIVGDSLVNPNDPRKSFYEDDVIFFKTRFEKSEIKPHTICLVYIESLDLYRPRKVSANEATGEITLIAVNPEYEDEHYSADNLIRIVGIYAGKFTPPDD